jgi:hypothetical protein
MKARFAGDIRGKFSFQSMGLQKPMLITWDIWITSLFAQPHPAYLSARIKINQCESES